MAKGDNPTLGPFLGLNNRLPPNKLHTKEGDFLAGAVNVDIKPGRVKQRAGYALSIAGTDCHSIWGDDGQVAYYADGANLYRVRTGPTGLSRETLRSNLTAGQRLSYARIGNVIYYSNGIERGMIGAGSTREDWGTMPDLTDASKPSYLWRPMPAGSIVRYYKGRLLVARGSGLYLAEPYTPQVYTPHRDYIPLHDEITLVAPVDGGVYLGTSRITYWLPGDLDKTEMVEVLGYGAVPRTDTRNADGEAIWMSTRGIVRGAKNGEAKNLQEQVVAVDAGSTGATLYRELDGMKTAVSAVSGIDASNMAASSYMSAEIVRKGVTL